MVRAGGEPLLPELHRRLKQLLGLSLRERTLDAVRSIGALKEEELRFPFLKYELTSHPSLCVPPERHRCGEGQAQAARLEDGAFGLQQRLMGLSSIVEGRAAVNRKAYCALNATDAAVKMVIPG